LIICPPPCFTVAYLRCYCGYYLLFIVALIPIVISRLTPDYVINILTMARHGSRNKVPRERKTCQNLILA
ncbi:hypothetical protein L9F63_027839, partial [Diploptera punctata]